MSFHLFALLLVQVLAASATKIHTPTAPAVSPHQTPGVSAVPEAAHRTKTSWFDKFKLAFGAPANKDAHTSLNLEGAMTVKTVDESRTSTKKSLLSKFQLAFGAPAGSAHEDARVMQVNLLSEAANKLASWVDRVAFGRVRQERSFLQSNEAHVPTVQASLSGTHEVATNKATTPGVYVMGPGLRVFYVLVAIICTLLVIVSCAFLIKTTPGNASVQGAED
eukprot:TRINITY_DN114993_c0_g1_i1.p1 TRINITY_DN114993_c0_g1~~TRINITY_DN114993_c0_g1_i1.p1  ORF type:complete len:221 (-),score=36.85 TRINITY_DN114993_c0_g1_i1:312-974(-)